MPNGRSGGFVIERTDLKNLVRTFPDETIVARIYTSIAALRPGGALEADRLVDECTSDRIAVEEQDHVARVIHLRNEPEIIWLSVSAKDPIFSELRQRHRQRTTEHPTGEDGLLSEDAKAGSTSVSAWFPNCARNGATAGGTKGGAYRRDPDPWPSRGTPRGSRDPNSDAPHHPLDGQFLAQQKKARQSLPELPR